MQKTRNSDEKTNNSTLKRTELDVIGRDEIIIIVAELDNGKGFHFCMHPLLSGVDSNLWYPLCRDEGLFLSIEKVMVMNHIAKNVVNITPLNKQQNYADYRVIFNVYNGH